MKNDLSSTIKRVLREELELQEFSGIQRTKIRIDSLDNEEKSDDEKSHNAKLIGSLFNGFTAIEFVPDDWYDGNGNKLRYWEHI